MSQVQEFYRKDIDGLRAIAILAVVAYHVGLPGVPGGFVGVDVFFVLSGYLITSLLVAEARRDDTISLRSFYARRIRRLFPALFVVVCVTCLLGFFALLPIFDQQQDLARSAIATALYVSNFYFWLHSPGYFDQSSSLQPLLHTWSLSVEEQFYLIWPLMVLGTVWATRRRGFSFEKNLLLLTLIILVMSLAWCIHSTKVTPTAAFYLLPSRAWELAAGAALAIWLPRVSSSGRAIGCACSFLGILLVALAVTTLQEDERFPGYLAVLPVLGTVLVVAGGHVSPTNPVQRVLSIGPMVFIGLLSYSWYLWHWPLLALARAYSVSEFDLARDISIGALSLLLAYASYRWVENPIRFGRPGPFRRTETTLAAGIVISIAMLVPAGALGAWAKFIGSAKADYEPMVAAANDRPPLRQHCHQNPPFNQLNPADRCTAGDSTRPVRLFLWGDSHADQLSPLLQAFTDRSPDTPALVRSFTGCPPLLGATTIDTPQRRACKSFNEAVLAEIQALHRQGLEGVVIAGRWLNMVASDRGRRDGWVMLDETVSALSAQGLRVLLVSAIPEMPTNVPACLARRSADECGALRAELDQRHTEVLMRLNELAARHQGVRVFDPFPSLCSSTNCPAVAGNLVLYLDDNHLTATGARSLLPGALGELAWVAGGR